jgi:hypothetical protein
MTTKVVIACPDQSVHNALVYVETYTGDGVWARNAPAAVIKPHGQAEPLYLTASTRVVIEEEPLRLCGEAQASGAHAR